MDSDSDNLVQNIYTVGGHSVGLWKCSSCSSLHRADINSTDELLPYGPVQLSRLCWETHQTFLRQHVWMRLPGAAGLTVQPDWVVGTASCYRQWEDTNKTRHKSVRIRREQLSVATICKTIPFLGGSIAVVSPVVSFICTKAGKTDSQSLMLPNQTDWYPWSSKLGILLTNCNRLLIPNYMTKIVVSIVMYTFR